MVDQSQIDVLKQQQKEIEALEAQVDEFTPLVADLWHRYIGTGDTVPSVFVVAKWLSIGDLHDIRDAMIEVSDEEGPDALAWEFDELLPVVELRIREIASKRTSPRGVA